MVYLCLMLNNVKNMTSATSLSLFSPLYKKMAHNEDGEEMGGEHCPKIIATIDSFISTEKLEQYIRESNH